MRRRRSWAICSSRRRVGCRRSDLAEAKELLTAREYGLALEVIADGLRQTKHIESFIDLILKLAREMEIENQPCVKALNKR